MPMKMPKASTGAISSYEKLTAAHPTLEKKQMFGQPVAFVNGNMFFGVFGDRLFLRLSKEDRAEIGGTPGAVPFEPMKGRPMMEYVVLPDRILAVPKDAALWVARGLAFVTSLPPKRPKSKSVTKPASSRKKQ